MTDQVNEAKIARAIAHMEMAIDAQVGSRVTLHRTRAREVLAALQAAQRLATHPSRGVVDEVMVKEIIAKYVGRTSRIYLYIANALARAQHEANKAVALPADHAMTCTCPSGDGSLRWPCPQHPPTSDSTSDLHQHLLDMLGAKDHVDAGRIIGELHAAALPAVPAFDMLAHLQRQREWSGRTFGPGPRTAGVIDHIRKELREIEADPTDLSEWIDVVILALDGAWRAGGTPEQIIATLVAKQTKNEGRTWPDWRTADPDKAIEHDRAQDAQPAVPSVPEGWRVMMATAPQSSVDRWEIYNPNGDGGVVNTVAIRDWVVSDLLDALATPKDQPAQTDDRCSGCGRHSCNGECMYGD